MATYPPPNFIEPLTIFNRNNWRTPLEAQQQVSPINPANFLQFPVAQGTETFADLISVGTANLTNISIADTTSVTSTSISQSTAGVLTIDNNQTVGGSIVFKANNSASVEKTILTLSGDSGTTAALPMTLNSGLTVNGNATIDTAFITNTLQIFNGLNSSTLDMDANNDFLITNNKASQRIILTALDASLIATNTATLGASPNGGFVASSSIGRAITATSTNTSGNSIGVFATANLNAFSGKSNAVGFTNGRINLGVSASGSYNTLTSGNDGFVVAENTAVDLAALTLTTYSTTRLGIRINSNSINSVEVAGALIQLNATTLGGITSTTPQPPSSDSTTKIPTTAWVQSAISAVSIPFYQISGNYVGTQVSAPYNSLRGAQIQFGFLGGNWAINDFFTLRITYSSAIAATAVISDSYTQQTLYCDVYPSRCPANSGTTNGPYGDNQNAALNLVTNQPLFTNSIWNGTAYVSTYVAPIVATYNPAGRWFWTNNYISNVPAGASIVPSNLNPIQPYAINGTAAAGGFGINILDLYPRNGYKQFFDVSIELVNRGIAGGGITLTTSSLPAGVTVNKSGW